jgi:anthranilate synthase component 1
MSVEEMKKTASEVGYPCVMPLVRTIRNIDQLSPTDVYSLLRKSNCYSFLLESAELGEKVARYSFIGRDPHQVITVKNGKLNIDGKTVETKNPLMELAKLISRYKVAEGRLPKFFGGLLGYFSYDMVRYFEEIGNTVKDELGHEDAEFMFVKDLIAFDHWREEILLISNLLIEDEAEVEREYARAVAQIEKMETLLKTAEKEVGGLSKTSSKLRVKSNFKKAEFEAAVTKAKKYIEAGDIFQVVLSQRFEVEGTFKPFDVYLALKEVNPSPYMYILEFGETKIIGSSPEILVKVDGRTVTVRPIAGTRPRGGDIVEDEELSREMLNDEKERAEHVMLVDLGRNDVGRVSSFGSVEVTEFFGVEKYSHVQHIISNVNGELEFDIDSFDALEAAFPAGTVTGAPKVRAMEIIEELEPSRRGIYAGSVGYFCFDGNMDFAITIRTIVLEDGRAIVQAGAGIVADSIPESEFKETENKGKGMLRALELTMDGSV